MDASSFWAIELTKGNPEATWPAETPDDEAEEDVIHALEVERACLGASAKGNEVNVVSVSTVTDEGEAVPATPIVRLKIGAEEQCRVGLQFPTQVTFKLISGNGPVHLMGLHQKVFNEEEEGEFDSDEESDELDESADSLPAVKPQKRSATAAGMPPAKKQHRGLSMPADDDEDDSQDEDSEEDSDEEMDMVAKSSKGKGRASRLAAMFADAGDDDDDDSDEDDEDFELDVDGDDDGDSDEGDDDEEDASDDEEVPQLVQVGKSKKQGNQKQQGKGQQQQQKGGKPNGQAPQQKKGQQQQAKAKAQPGTPQKGTPQKEKGAKDNTPMSVEAIRKKLSTSPNLPKKQDKFANYMKSTYRCTDQKAISDLWQFVQKQRK